MEQISLFELETESEKTELFESLADTVFKQITPEEMQEVVDGTAEIVIDNQILPCPNCGCDHPRVAPIFGKANYRIACPACCKMTDRHETKQEAIDDWNKMIRAYVAKEAAK